MKSKRLNSKKKTIVFIHQMDNTIPKEILNAKNTLMEEIKNLESRTCNILKVPNLISEAHLEEIPCYLSPLYGKNNYREVFGGGGYLPDGAFVYTGSYVLSDANISQLQSLENTKRYVRGGPRKHNYFHPSQVKSAIVTCGGLCPGLNVVIRELFLCLFFNYGVKDIYGISYGYRGFYLYDWKKLELKDVQEIQRLGGTILGSSRGGFDGEKIIENLIKNEINHVYCLGGDGTHRGIQALYNLIKQKQLNIVICGIPKTIDNDIPVIDKSFGFETSVEEAVNAITSASVEAHCAEYGVGLVRLMGRHAGFIAMEATNASRDANVCLVPEFKFQIYGEDGVLEYIYRRLLVKKHCVVVVAEGAGEAAIDAHLSHSNEKDASGNNKLADIGIFLQKEIVEYGKQKGIEITLKYINPTYMIRTVPANALDRKMCAQLSQNAVHGAMAGFTGFTVGHINGRLSYIPLDEICKENSTRRIKPEDRAWQRLLASTGQPTFLSKEKQQEIYEKQQQDI
ncbi:phosphofructokinase family protein, putative [Ichthyophthirius multifiliis]|uniref:Phosphofructokinase family protein, putative n=1 Tax=Ichthyophthirius multifiliis TaxID=5932 RepID=G0QMX5_ICHMU|nr:phosphofructokinase family protein, putative [Ichthyophthirius multifiliis]EGR33429.1 phosphofructokinase family protein, putative [Ichthyophthirius multifiliis]|eukprot:XP_004037415.1 phosphofructokinase family protein, putative [Ichthyophthirius multifiliis]